MQLNPLYYVEFRDIYPLRRSAAFKITEFWPLNKVEKALSVVEEGCFTPFLCGGIPLTFGGIH